MGKNLIFNSSNITLECIPNRSTIKIEAMGGGSSINEDILKALNNPIASNDNLFGSSDNITDVIRELNAPPPGYPLLVTKNRIVTIPRSGNYTIYAVGGGGSGGIVGRDYNLIGVEEGYSNDGNDTSFQIKDKTFTALKGLRGRRYIGGMAQISYDKEKGIGGTNGGSGNSGKDGKGQDGFYGGGYGSRVFKAGGGGGSPFPFNPYNVAGGNGRSKMAYGGKGYGAGGGADVHDGARYTAGGGSSGCLITEKFYLEKDTEIKITIGKGGAGGYSSRDALSSGSGASGAVMIEWDLDQDI